MNNVNHPNIARIYDIFDTKNRLYIVLEYICAVEPWEKS